MKWAIPATEEEAEQGPTDELGMSEKDREEKKEWQAKRKAGRGDAIERMKMKEADAKKEKERVELETFKRENPDQYQQMLQQQEEDRRQAQEMKRRERLAAAALERKRRQASGESEDSQIKADKPKRKKGNKSSGSWLYTIFSLLFIAGILGAVYFLAINGGVAKSKNGGGGKRSKRG